MLDTVFFLSDYGRQDEFVGVVHAVLRRLAPEVRVIDLTHDVAPFDVRAGAWTLARAVDHLGPGVVLAVVDPGVGGARRAVALRSSADSGPSYFVGPDNGLLIPALESAGPVAEAVDLGDGDLGEPSGVDGSGATFAGRDLFAPAVAHLCTGRAWRDLGPAVDPAELVRVPEPVLELGRTADGHPCLRAEVVWVDRFGNVQLPATAGDLSGAAVVSMCTARPGEVSFLLRRVAVFDDLMVGEPGVLVDANGRLALVMREGSAAASLGVGTGDLVELTW
jgi:S-adenosylmethionine hydrolase